MSFVFLTILFALFAILAWRNLKMALVLLSGLLPIYLIRFEIGLIPSTALEILILICAVAWIYSLIRHPERVKRVEGSLRIWMRPTLLLIAAACFGVVIAPDTFAALGIWKAYFIEPVLVAIMMLTMFDRKDWTRSLQALSVSVVVLSTFAIIQYFTGTGIPAPWDIELRVTSFFDYPNALGLFLAPIISLNVIKLALSPFPRGSWRGLPWISITSIILGLIAIILSKTEAALVAIPVAVIVALLISQILIKKKSIVLVTLVLLVLGSLLSPTIREKLTLQDYSGQVRISQWTETLEVVKEKPLFGAGLNGYPAALAPHHDSTLYEIFQYPHNIFLNTWSELGILGLIALLWFAWLILRKLVILRRNDEGSTRVDSSCLRMTNTKLALFAALLTIFIHGLVDVPYFKNDLAVLTWILLAAFIINSKPTKQP